MITKEDLIKQRDEMKATVEADQKTIDACMLQIQLLSININFLEQEINKCPAEIKQPVKKKHFWNKKK